MTLIPVVSVLLSAQDVPPEILACIANGTKVGHSFIQHPDPAKLKDALKAYESRSADYPEGTILRMIPGEAMVKRIERGISAEQRMGVLRAGGHTAGNDSAGAWVRGVEPARHLPELSRRSES
ncbi:MAG: hypothetical protein QM736_01520 [Vicinamibacterales bacterium]